MGQLAAGRIALLAVVAALSLTAEPASSQQASAAGSGSDARSLLAQADSLRFAEDWYGAVEGYLQALSRNPSYAEAAYGLAECYYELEEYDQALSWVKRAAPLMRGDSALADLEGFVRIGLGDTVGAGKAFSGVLTTRPNDLDARFGMALLDLAAGKKAEARAKFEDSLRISPQNARALLSLAILARDQGRDADAKDLLDRALRYHGQEARTQYVAARVAAQGGDLAEASSRARTALDLKPGYQEARLLLGQLMYQTGDMASSITLMREAVARNRKDGMAWYTLGLAQAGAGKFTDAIYSLKAAQDLRPDDELVTVALENIVMDTTPAEDPSRQAYADFHFRKGSDLAARSMNDQAIFEYRLGLRVYPYSAKGRLLYAELLKQRGFPAKYLSELRFLKDNGKADQATLDAIEIYDSLLVDSVDRRWGLDEEELPKRPYRIAIFYRPDAASSLHASGEALLTRYLKDILGSSTRLTIVPMEAATTGFADAFRRARESDADYFLVLGLRESERDFQISGELRVARTGSPATAFNAYRTGNDRVRNAVSRIADLLQASLVPEGRIVKRSQDRAFVDLGRADGAKVGDKLLVLRKGALQVRPEGLGQSYPQSALLGELSLVAIGEESSEGTLKSSGFYDTMNVGDVLVFAPPAPSAGGTASTPGVATAGGQTGTVTPPVSAPTATPEPDFPALFSFIRTLR